jgi:hypothetical protein
MGQEATIVPAFGNKLRRTQSHWSFAACTAFPPRFTFNPSSAELHAIPVYFQAAIRLTRSGLEWRRKAHRVCSPMLPTVPLPPSPQSIYQHCKEHSTSSGPAAVSCLASSHTNDAALHPCLYLNPASRVSPSLVVLSVALMHRSNQFPFALPNRVCQVLSSDPWHVLCSAASGKASVHRHPVLETPRIGKVGLCLQITTAAKETKRYESQYYYATMQSWICRLASHAIAEDMTVQGVEKRRRQA